MSQLHAYCVNMRTHVIGRRPWFRALDRLIWCVYDRRTPGAVSVGLGLDSVSRGPSGIPVCVWALGSRFCAAAGLSAAHSRAGRSSFRSERMSS